MVEFPETRESLLIRVRNPRDHEAWTQFASLYRPVVFRLARLRGLQDADAEELAQQVLLAVSKSIVAWNRHSAEIRFHYWLQRVIANAIRNALTRRPQDRAVGGLVDMEILQGAGIASDGQSSDETAELELAYRRQLLRLAAATVRKRADEATWQAFELTTIDGQTVIEAARKLGCTVGSVYAARSRVVRRLRDEVHKLEAQIDARSK